VVIEGRRDADAERRAATGLLSVIDRDELDAYGDTSALEVLQRQAGITLDGDQPRLRGLGAGYTLILLNGEPAPPGFSLDSLNPADIERIEIVKGPSAEFGGTAGTINVILRRAPPRQQREARLTLGQRGSQPQATASASWGDRSAGGAWGWFLPLTLSRNVQVQTYDSERRTRDRAGTVSLQAVQGRDRTEAEGLTFTPRLDWKISETDALQLQSFLQFNQNTQRNARQTQALQGPLPWAAQDRSESDNAWETARLQAQWTRRQPSGQRLELKGSAQSHHWQQEGRSQATAPDGSEREPTQSQGRQREQRLSLGARWRVPVGAAHALSLGLDVDERERRDLRRQFRSGVEQFGGSLGLPSEGGSRSTTVFVQDEWTPAPAWTFSLGLRGTEAQLYSQGPEGQARGRFAALLPVASLRHALDPAGRRLLRASLAQAQRVPEAALLLPRYVLNGQYDRDSANTPIAADTAGNPALQPERSRSLELVLEQHFAGGGLVSIGVSHRRIDDLIRRRLALERVPEASVPRWVSRPVNLGRAHSTSLELEWKQRLPAAWLQGVQGLDVRAGLSLYRSTVEQIDDPDARLEGQAPWSATLGLTRTWPGTPWSAGASLVLGPGFEVQQSDRQRVTRGASRRLDAYLQWRYSRELQLRLAATQLLARDSFNASRVADLDGFAASAQTRRPVPAQLNANLVWRF
jgi:iron complex outermembrane receptor protein